MNLPCITRKALDFLKLFSRKFQMLENLMKITYIKKYLLNFFNLIKSEIFINPIKAI